MEDLARLQIRVQSQEAELANRRLKSLADTGERTERATDGVTGSFKRFLGPAVAAAGAVATLTKVVNVTKQFGALNAQLITATGSAANAEIAFDAIQGFATRTPFDLAGVTDAFVKLVNLGLDPSERALTSYGNTASAMGRDLNQLIEAVADAATGEFERLKEFGIKAKSEGDKVSFTFRGVTTQIGKNAAEIEQYLIALGENEFAGAMNERTKTLGGALSNLAGLHLLFTPQRTEIGRRRSRFRPTPGHSISRHIPTPGKSPSSRHAIRKFGSSHSMAHQKAKCYSSTPRIFPTAINPTER